MSAKFTASASGVPPMPEEFKKPDLVQIGHFAPLEELKFKGACGEAFKDVLRCGEKFYTKTDEDAEKLANMDPKKAEEEYERKVKEWENLAEGEIPASNRNLVEDKLPHCRVEERDLIECLHWNPEWPEQS